MSGGEGAHGWDSFAFQGYAKAQLAPREFWVERGRRLEDTGMTLGSWGFKLCVSVLIYHGMGYDLAISIHLDDSFILAFFVCGCGPRVGGAVEELAGIATSIKESGYSVLTRSGQHFESWNALFEDRK